VFCFCPRHEGLVVFVLFTVDNVSILVYLLYSLCVDGWHSDIKFLREQLQEAAMLYR